jgi:hypothetical protein
MATMVNGAPRAICRAVRRSGSVSRTNAEGAPQDGADTGVVATVDTGAAEAGRTGKTPFVVTNVAATGAATSAAMAQNAMRSVNDLLFESINASSVVSRHQDARH